MKRAHVDISKGLEGEPVVFACFDLNAEQIAASTHAIAVASAERYRRSAMSADDVLRLRELMALADDLGEIVPGMRTVVLRPARLAVYRDAIAHFVDIRDGAEWIRAEDREQLALVRGLLLGLDQLYDEAVRAALGSGGPSSQSPAT
jgi:hypothetical protein